ncbi:MAG: hypothetical protein IT206_08150 [Fimbriimonadaceae bacterium]|nr:hypothetical protein [Fimbriimonadaceae bacterium]
MKDQETAGLRILTLVFSMAGISVIGFGVVQLIARQYLTGGMILFIGLSDFVIMFLFLRHLKSSRGE